MSYLKSKLFLSGMRALMLALVATGTAEAEVVFTQSSIRLTDLTEGTAFLFDLSSYAISPDHSPVTFSLIGGPSFITLSADGTLRGNPARGDVGPVTMVVGATTGEGTTAKTVVSFNVRAAVRPQNKVSILWVVQNAKVMAAKRSIISDSFHEFFEILQSGPIDYRMAVTTTETFSDPGRLIALASGGNVVSRGSKNPSAELRDLWKQIVDTQASFWPQGLEASRAAIRGNPTFLDADSSLVVIYVSQSDDYSCQHHCFGREPRNNPDWVAYPIQTYTDFFRDSVAPTKTVTVFPVVGREDDECVTQSIGYRYARLRRELGGGSVKSICDAHLPKSIASIARAINQIEAD